MASGENEQAACYRGCVLDDADRAGAVVPCCTGRGFDVAEYELDGVDLWWTFAVGDLDLCCQCEEMVQGTEDQS